ncbi:hypothetical protein B0T19DRAFT_446534 [Cercophora scortea]|uniref:Rhodopsin domain-containing protein n=1 Tax=Cercophora scortea TaxID=314031 RepID=A0AAE0I352_9PEZI|nr:hypothetical protein B0T19DRAFT_446534 [Cercophora scortea]
MDDSKSHDSRGPEVIHSFIALVIVTLFFILLRFYCKARYQRAFGWDDYVLALAWIILLASVIIVFVGVKFGFGQHTAQIPPSILFTGTEIISIAEFVGPITIALAQTSIALTLLRFARSKWHRRTIWGVIATVNLTKWTSVILLFASCHPVEKRWNPFVEGDCLDIYTLTYVWMVTSSWGAAMNLVLVALPWMMIWPLQMRKAEKIGLGFSMSLGVLSAAIAITKTVVHLAVVTDMADFTYTFCNLTIWTAAETSTIIVAASFPFLRLLLKEFSRKAAARSSRRRPNGSQHRSGSGGSGSTEFSTLPIPKTEKPDLKLAAQHQRAPSAHPVSAETEPRKSTTVNGGGGGITKTSEIVVLSRDRDSLVKDRDLELGLEAPWSTTITATGHAEPDDGPEQQDVDHYPSRKAEWKKRIVLQDSNRGSTDSESSGITLRSSRSFPRVLMAMGKGG